MTTPQKYALTIIAIVLLITGTVIMTSRYTPNTDFATLQAFTVPVSSLIPGTMTQVSIHDNQFVEAGTHLFSIDPEPITITLAQTTEAYKVALARFQEMNQLFQANNASHDQLLQASNALYASVRALAEARYQQKHTNTYAPVSGYITNLEARQGLYAQPGRRILSLIDDSEWWIYANIKENNLNRIQPGQTALISFNTCPGLIITGQVDTIARGVDDSSTGSRGLAKIERTNNWIRLAQRFPVHITFDRTQVPLSCQLREGATTITTIITNDNWFNRSIANIIQSTRTYLQFIY